MTKAEADKRLKRIYSRLRECDFDVMLNSNLGRCFGQITADFEITTKGLNFVHLIELNPNKGGKSFIKTILHECLHLAYWNTPEKLIVKWENEMFPLLSDRQLTNLLKRLYG